MHSLKKFRMFIETKLSSIVSLFHKKTSNSVFWIILKETLSILWIVQKYVSASVFLGLLLLFSCAQLSAYLSKRDDDEDYTPIFPTDNHNFILYFVSKAIPNTLQALVELVIIADQYGFIEEDKFSQPLKTQLYKNFFLRCV